MPKKSPSLSRIKPYCIAVAGQPVAGKHIRNAVKELRHKEVSFVCIADEVWNVAADIFLDAGYLVVSVPLVSEKFAAQKTNIQNDAVLRYFAPKKIMVLRPAKETENKYFDRMLKHCQKREMEIINVPAVKSVPKRTNDR